jgi:hypothetical protein
VYNRINQPKTSGIFNENWDLKAVPLLVGGYVVVVGGEY